MSRDLENIILELKNPEEEMRIKALKKLCKLEDLADFSLLEHIYENFKDDNRHVRISAVLACYKITRNSIVFLDEIIDHYQEESSPQVREACAFVISEKIKKNFDLPAIQTHLKVLLEKIEDASIYEKRHLCYAFGFVKSKKIKKSILKFLINCAKSSIIDLKLQAIEAIAKLEENYNSLFDEVIEGETDEVVKLKILNYNREDIKNGRKNNRKPCQGTLNK